uniref:Uncharacterized protein n=1 Tax=Arundo donax TaxID=35708 RepID=A0A0A9G9E6_ARUDO
MWSQFSTSRKQQAQNMGGRVSNYESAGSLPKT